MDINIVALIASIVSIVLAFFAIWQANHHRDQSDKLNRDTTEKLARIEAFATSTKEDAFAEIRRWGDFARAGGKAFEEAEKAKEEEIRKLKDAIQATTSAEINKVLQTVENKLSSSTESSTIAEIKNEFDDLKKEISKIQEKAVADIKQTEKMPKIFYVLGLASPQEIDILKAIAHNPDWTKLRNLEELGYESDQINRSLVIVRSQGLLKERINKHDRALRKEVKLDEDLKEVLLR